MLRIQHGRLFQALGRFRANPNISYPAPKRYIFTNHVVSIPKVARVQPSFSSQTFDIDSDIKKQIYENSIRIEARNLLQKFCSRYTSPSSSGLADITAPHFQTYIHEKKPSVQNILKIHSAVIFRRRWRVGHPEMWSPFFQLNQRFINNLRDNEDIVVIWREEHKYDAIVSIQLQDSEVFIGDRDDLEISEAVNDEQGLIPVIDVKINLSLEGDKLHDVYIRLEKPGHHWIIGDIDYFYTNNFLQHMNKWFGVAPIFGKRRRVLLPKQVL
ncbi:hypothetical protein NEOLI_002390 [Neolecta irregularis DAH-3]|uniref:Uncharacterized protein n=1 Tax=Neolecta irregularis (strain DAH-3) TaxID=1198029 RepID=A0A1U7LJB4_NEOID|nr:hypothetical protein NEOLI_002390 [Neolecta irregularis DAH-3]|eukprot:OLL22745.1 hypothetical protein NEOLI_002390 [Neolecta irregularis DAH-3]